jgi:sugar phosphate isomerase/epimerase
MTPRPTPSDGRSLAPDDLICAHYTLGGLDGTLSLEQRAAAAASGGFEYLGWLGDAYAAERAAGLSDADIRATLADHGVAVGEVEFLWGWATAGDPGTDWRQQEATLFELADLVGADHLNCGDIGLSGPMLPLDDVAERFAGICDRAAEHGLRVGLEFLPWSEIPNAAVAWEIARLAGRRNGGVLVDSWHYFRGSSDAAQLSAIPPEQIILIQLSDAGPVQGDPMDDTSHRRRPPGEGELDLVGLLRQLDQMGVRAPISVEVFSDELTAGPPAEAARRVFEGASATLAAARKAR